MIRKGSKLVGIVYGEYDDPLYCEDWGREYYVINGDWGFAKTTEFLFRRKDCPWRVVLDDMDEMPYTKACQLIREAAQK